ncbi:MAG TPA: cytochrome c peroxidase, partial [Bauldia sp.]|nr:cytochrome c peroxidase [Bauldia sp.]
MVVAASAFAFAAVPPGPDPGPLSRQANSERVAALMDLGHRMFFDSGLSASGTMSCATCHDPTYAFGPPNALPVQLGGPHLDLPGVRAAPSIKYLQATPQFTEHFFDSEDEGDESVDNGPTGGLMWDGRADRGQDQARFPLLSPFEMANAGP